MQAQAATPEQGGTLTVPIITQTFLEDFNPLNGVQADIVSGTMFEPLWVQNTMAGEINWRLAESFTYGADKKSMTITLKDDLTWSDGEVLDADDLLFSLAIGGDDIKLDHTGQWANGVIESVEKVSDRAVKINFSEVNTTIDWYMPALWVIPEHIWADIDDKINYKNPNPVGSGPITEVTTVRGNQIEICRNPHYYKADQGLPYLDCIKFRQYSDNSQIQPALMADEIDWGSNFVADIDKTYVEPSPDTHGYWYPANDLWNLYMNTREAPFDRVEFRKAVSMAIDRETIVDLATYGYATPESSVVGIGEFFGAHFNDKVNKKYADLAEYNPDEAIKLLDKAGYKDVDGDGYRENPDGTEIDFDIHIVNGWTDVVQAVQMVTEYLADVGIKANTRTLEWSVYDAALKDGTYDMSFNWSVTNGQDPIQAYLNYYHPARVGEIWHANHGMASEELGALVDEYSRIDDQDRREEILAELMTFTAENLPFVPVMSNATWFQYNTTRVDGFPSDDNPYVHPNFYNGGSKLLVFENLHAK
ncbi:ABC-type dipeptide transport system, periplasmic component [Reinekea sp. MED297]|uniref:ABC-type dipeptide transport system, periplasmic component n=2 Tax=Reinekea TaxID=230494 RepID=A4BA57_9GAMM|nr:ABC-type dipeptide transport system, periplasmic component [Reinekea sp. MED297] [Reinekea blandensis MED297]